MFPTKPAPPTPPPDARLHLDATHTRSHNLCCLRIAVWEPCVKVRYVFVAGFCSGNGALIGPWKPWSANHLVQNKKETPGNRGHPVSPGGERSLIKRGFAGSARSTSRARPVPARLSDHDCGGGAPDANRVFTPNNPATPHSSSPGGSDDFPLERERPATPRLLCSCRKRANR